MRKDEIERSYHQGYRGAPMANVKVYKSITAEIVRSVADEYGWDGLDLEWVEETLERDDWAFWTACEQGWEMLQEDAEAVFGSRVKVGAAGRCGGWCVVEGLPDLDTWDAIDLGRWARFAKWARQQADDIPYRTVWTLGANVWESEQEAFRQAFMRVG